MAATRSAHSRISKRTRRICERRSTRFSSTCSSVATLAFFDRRVNFLAIFCPLLNFRLIFYPGIKRRPKIDRTNSTTKKMVALNNDLSRPRRVVYNSPLAPKPAPSDAPRCCNRIRSVLKTAEIKVTVSKMFPKFIYQLYWTFLRMSSWNHKVY